MFIIVALRDEPQVIVAACSAGAVRERADSLLGGGKKAI